MYQPLTEQTVAAYVQRLPLEGVFQPGEPLEGIDLADGNVNLVFRVRSTIEPRRSVIVKQALPYARIVGESFPMPLERARIEADLLAIEGELVPGLVPQLYHHDHEMYAIVMQDLNQHVIMRSGLVRQVVYPHFAEHIGNFLARTLFYTSDLYLPHDVKKHRAAKHVNPGLCKVTEDLVFTDPYTTNDGNRWNSELDPQVAAIRADDALRSEFYLLKEEFMTKGEALIHGDLHTGSIMVNAQETKVIDPEFAFYGPMAFDTGLLMANLALSYCSQPFHTSDPAPYQRWLLDTMRQCWAVFEREFRSLWAQELNPQWGTDAFREKYLLRLLRSTAGYAAAEVMRRILGLAHVSDLESIADPKQRAVAESRALNIGRTWIMNYRGIATIDDLVKVVEESAPSYPYASP